MISHSIFRVAVLVLLLSASHQVLGQRAKRARSADDPAASGQTKRNKGNRGKPSPQQTYVPLSARHKLAYGAHQAFLNPFAYLSPAVDAFFTERRDVKAPGKTFQDKFADGMTHYARSFTTDSTATLLSSGIYPVLFKQDPRYHLSGKHGFMSRALYAASRTVVTRGDNGKLQPNYSRFAGTLTSAALANLYERDLVKARNARGAPISFRRRVGTEPTLLNFGITMAMNAATDIAFHEFDLAGKLLKVLRKH